MTVFDWKVDALCSARALFEVGLNALKERAGQIDERFGWHAEDRQRIWQFAADQRAQFDAFLESLRVIDRKPRHLRLIVGLAARVVNNLGDDHPEAVAARFEQPARERRGATDEAQPRAPRPVPRD